MGSSPHLLFCACKTATLAHELLVSMGPSPHLWFLLAKHRLLDPNNKSLWVPDVTCMQNSKISIRITSLYGFQHQCVVFACKEHIMDQNFKSPWFPDLILRTHNCVLNTRIKRLYWFQPSPVVLCMQNSAFRTRITSLGGSKTPPVVFAGKRATSGPE